MFRACVYTRPATALFFWTQCMLCAAATASATTASATPAAVRTIHVRRNVRFQTALTDVQVGDAHDEHPRNHHEAEQRRTSELVELVL